MALIVTTWLWGNKYGTADVAKLASSVRRHLKEPHRFICLTDNVRREPVEGVDYREIPNPELTKVQGCFARLRIFDPQWQFLREIYPGDRIVNMDLDTVVTGGLDPLFYRPELFLILQGANSANPCKFNGSLMMLRAGAHADVWTDFTLDKAKAVPFYEFPDDQGWLWHKIPDAVGWNAGPMSGVYAFQKPGWPKGEALPADARLVVFPGWRSPEKFKRLPWVKEHWKA